MFSANRSMMSGVETLERASIYQQVQRTASLAVRR